MTTRLKAPISFDTASSDAYLGANDLQVHGARLVQVGFQGDSGLEDGTLKIRLGEGASVEVGVPASNLWTIQMPSGCSSCLPVLTIDAKAAAGTPKLTVLAV